MKKEIMLVISSLLFLVLFFSGCVEGGFDLSDPFGFERSSQICVVGIIIVVVLIVLLLVGLAKAGTGGKSVIVQSPPQTHQPIREVQKESKSNRRCPECGRVIPEDANMCPYCGKKFKSYFEEDEKTDNKEKTKEIEEKKEKKDNLNQCPECGAQIEEGNSFCTNCGKKIK